MKCFRELPRYDVSHLRGFLVTQVDGNKVSIPIKNVSLGGMQLICGQEVLIEISDAEVHLIEKKPFSIQVINVWRERNYQNQYQSGYSFKFKDVKTFQRWIQIMKALHLHKSKKQS